MQRPKRTKEAFKIGGLSGGCNAVLLSDEQLKFLKKAFPNTPNKEIATKLNVSLSAITNYARRFGLKKDVEYIRLTKSLNSSCELKHRIFNRAEYLRKWRKQNGKKYSYYKSKSKTKTRAKARTITKFDKFWTDERKAELLQLYPNHDRHFLTNYFGVLESNLARIVRILQLKKSPEFRSSNGKIYGSRMSKERQQLVDFISEKHDIKVFGATITKKGFIRVNLVNSQSSHRRFVSLQNEVWKKHNGEIPKNHVVTFKDFNPTNCDISNLEIVTLSDLKLRKGLMNCPEHMRPVAEALIELRRELSTRPRKGEYYPDGKRNTRNPFQTRYKNYRSHSYWTDADTEFLKSNYHKLRNKEIAEHLKRPLSSITTHAFQLGLTGLRGFGYRAWTDEKIAKLKELYPTTKNKDIADFFGCCKATITVKARELGLSDSQNRKKGAGRKKKKQEKQLCQITQ